MQGVEWTKVDGQYTGEEAVELFCVRCVTAIASKLDPEKVIKINQIKSSHVQAHRAAGHHELPSPNNFLPQMVYMQKQTPSGSKI